MQWLLTYQNPQSDGPHDHEQIQEETPSRSLFVTEPDDPLSLRVQRVDILQTRSDVPQDGFHIEMIAKSFPDLFPEYVLDYGCRQRDANDRTQRAEQVENRNADGLILTTGMGN